MLQFSTIMARFLSLNHLNLVFFLVTTTTFYNVVSGNTIYFTHHLVLYECDPSRTVYRFQYDPNHNNHKPSFEDVVHQESPFKLKKNGSEWVVETTDKRSAHLSTFSFRVNNTGLIVEVNGEVRPCDESSSTRCTILISVLASLCLLLFAGLALSLIVLKERRVPCFHKLTTWIQTRGGGQSRNQDQQSPSAKRPSAPAPDDIDLEHLKRIYEKGINDSNNNNKSSSPIEDSPPPVPPVNKPRKSSLKPPRTEAYPAPSFSMQPDGNIQENPGECGGSSSPGAFNSALNGGRRKSIVTFNERTEIRS